MSAPTVTSKVVRLRPYYFDQATQTGHVATMRANSEGGYVAWEDYDRLRACLERYMFAYPAFRMKPVGEPGSPARVESERLMALEELAQKLLRGEAP